MAAVFPPDELLHLPPWSFLIREFVQLLIQAVHEGQSVTSWFRSVEDNRRVGGDRESQHLLALAFDLVGPRLVQTMQTANMLGLTAVLEDDHLHVQRFPAGALTRAGVVFPPGPGSVRTL